MVILVFSVGIFVLSIHLYFEIQQTSQDHQAPSSLPLQNLTVFHSAFYRVTQPTVIRVLVIIPFSSSVSPTQFSVQTVSLSPSLPLCLIGDLLSSDSHFGNFFSYSGSLLIGFPVNNLSLSLILLLLG